MTKKAITSKWVADISNIIAQIVIEIYVTVKKVSEHNLIPA